MNILTKDEKNDLRAAAEAANAGQGDGEMFLKFARRHNLAVIQFQEKASPARVLALLDEIAALEKRMADLRA